MGIKILLCSPYKGTIGGIARWTGHILKYYDGLDDKEGIDLKHFSLSRSYSIHANTPSAKRFILGILDYFLISAKFLIYLIKNKITLVHVVSSGSLGLIKDILLLSICWLFRKKTIIHFRFGRIPELFGKRNWEYYLLSAVLKMSSRVIVIDLNTYEFLISKKFANVFYLPNPISPEIFKIVESSNFERIKNQILFAGHVVPTKGIRELIEATKDLPNIRVKIVGHCSEAMKQEILNISKSESYKYIFGGELALKETIEEMLKCDVFVLPSYTEGFPNVILEAMACGCPIIATNVGAIPEMLNYSKGKMCGIIIPVMDSAKLKLEIEKLLLDIDRKTLIGEKAKNKVFELYNINIIWEKMVFIWNTLRK